MEMWPSVPLTRKLLESAREQPSSILYCQTTARDTCSLPANAFSEAHGQARQQTRDQRQGGSRNQDVAGSAQKVSRRTDVERAKAAVHRCFWSCITEEVGLMNMMPVSKTGFHWWKLRGGHREGIHVNPLWSLELPETETGPSRIVPGWRHRCPRQRWGWGCVWDVAKASEPRRVGGSVELRTRPRPCPYTCQMNNPPWISAHVFALKFFFYFLKINIRLIFSVQSSINFISMVIACSPPPRSGYRMVSSPKKMPFCRLFPQTLVSTDLLSITIVLSFRECHTNGIILYVTFWDWLLPFSTMPLRSFWAAACIKSSDS